jgi:soluble cytochrome b562
MSIIRRIVGNLASLAGVLGVLLCVAAIVGCWIAQARFIEWLDRTNARVDASLANVRTNLKSSNEQLKQTQIELTAVRQKEVQPDPVKGNFLLRAAIEANKPQLRDAKTKLVLATETGLILRGILEAFDDLNLGDHAETDRVKEASAQLSELIAKAEKITAKIEGVGPVDPEPDALMDGFTKLVRMLDDSDAGMDRIRERADEWYHRLHRYSLIAAVAITLISLWIGLGQWSFAIHGRRWGRR